MSLEQPLCLKSNQGQAVQLRWMNGKGQGKTVKYYALYLCKRHRQTFNPTLAMWMSVGEKRQQKPHCLTLPQCLDPEIPIDTHTQKMCSNHYD